MSLESLGSLARTVSDRFLRENLRRIIAGTNTSISSVLDGASFYRGVERVLALEIGRHGLAEPLACTKVHSYQFEIVRLRSYRQ